MKPKCAKTPAACWFSPCFSVRFMFSVHRSVNSRRSLRREEVASALRSCVMAQWVGSVEVGRVMFFCEG